MAFAWMNKIFGLDQRSGDAALRRQLKPLWQATVDEARRPAWYLDGKVPDTIDGRFDVLALVAGTVLLRLEDFGEEGLLAMARFAELFAQDMDGQLRQEGHGDVGVGNRVEDMVGALGGRLGALRGVREGKEDMEIMLARNLYRGAPPETGATSASEAMLKALATSLNTQAFEALKEGRIVTSR